MRKLGFSSIGCEDFSAPGSRYHKWGIGIGMYRVVPYRAIGEGFVQQKGGEARLN